MRREIILVQPWHYFQPAKEINMINESSGKFGISPVMSRLKYKGLFVVPISLIVRLVVIPKEKNIFSSSFLSIQGVPLK